MDNNSTSISIRKQKQNVSLPIYDFKVDVSSSSFQNLQPNIDYDVQEMDFEYDDVQEMEFEYTPTTSIIENNNVQKMDFDYDDVQDMDFNYDDVQQMDFDYENVNVQRFDKLKNIHGINVFSTPMFISNTKLDWEIWNDI